MDGFPLLETSYLCGPAQPHVRCVVSQTSAWRVQEAGNLQNVEYVIIHKGIKMRHKSLIAWVDKALGVKHVAASSIWAGWGQKYKPARIDGDSILK